MENAKRMLDSGIPRDEVISMLVSLGYNDADASMAVGGAPGIKEEQETESNFVAEEEGPSKKTTELAKDHAHHAELASTMAMNVVDNAAKTLDEHKEHMRSLNENITKTYDKLDSISLEKIDAAHNDISEIKKALADLAAKTNVTLDLMKKILENQRELIMKLK